MDVPQLVSVAMKVGEANLHTMQALETGHINLYGNPEPTQVELIF